MHVERAAPLVALGDAGGFRSRSKIRTKPAGTLKTGRVARKLATGSARPRRGLPPGAMASLSASQARRSSARSARMIDAIPFAVLLVFGVKLDMRGSARRAGVERRSRVASSFFRSPVRTSVL